MGAIPDADGPAEVSGVFLRAIPTTRAGTRSSLSVLTDILAAEGLADPEPDAWYPMDDALTVYDRIATEIGRCTLYRIGCCLARAMAWPEQVETIDAALSNIDTVYEQHHRGCSACSITHTSDRPGRGTIVFETPYPTVFEAGLVRGLDDQFGRPETFLAVRQGTSEDELLVRWWTDRIDHVDRIVPSMTRPDDVAADPRRPG